MSDQFFDDIEKLDEILEEANQKIETLFARGEIGDIGEYNEERENKIREQMQLLAHYAEEGPTFDSEGKYLCGSCLYRMVMDWATLDRCYIVTGVIRMVDGGCAIYRIGDPDSESNPLPILRQYSQVEAGYGERPEAKGFGCSRCSYSAEAKKKDSAGRPSWCRFWGVHVRPLACCDREDGPDMREGKDE